jgi:UDP-N-acetylmuramate dehydrogenase
MSVDNGRVTALDVRADVPLRDLCTLGVGGPARHYVEARTHEEVTASLAWAAERGLPVFVLGGGSNLVVADEGFPGLVLHIRLAGTSTNAVDGAVELTAASGEPWDPLVARAVEQGLAGLECLSGIPGFVGATPIQNVGAYGQDVAETITRVDALDTSSGRIVAFDREQCRFGYRESRFKLEDRGRYVILRVTFRLRADGAPAVRYAELERTLHERGLREPTLADVRRTVVEVRRRKSMVIDPDDPNRRSVGSFFMNPIVPPAAAAEVRARLERDGRGAEAAAMPSWPTADGRVKLSAAWLIERAGLARGYQRGRVGISTNHTLAIVNRGGATAAEVVALAREIRDRVRDRFGITLAPEPIFLNVSL